MKSTLKRVHVSKNEKSKAGEHLTFDGRHGGIPGLVSEGEGAGCLVEDGLVQQACDDEGLDLQSNCTNETSLLEDDPAGMYKSCYTWSKSEVS